MQQGGSDSSNSQRAPDAISTIPLSRWG